MFQKFGDMNFFQKSIKLRPFFQKKSYVYDKIEFLGWKNTKIYIQKKKVLMFTNLYETSKFCQLIMQNTFVKSVNHSIMQY